jgi:hypothetical protein
MNADSPDSEGTDSERTDAAPAEFSETPELTELTEAQRRRKRTNAYLALWAIRADVSSVPVPTSDQIVLPSSAAVIGRAKALALCSLKGQGLTQHEVFAFADAYEVWDHLTLAENDYVLDPAPESLEDVNYAWRYEGLKALEWCLGLLRHLGFPDQPSDPADAIKICIEDLCARSSEPVESGQRAEPGEPTEPVLRPVKELLDAADIARCVDAVAQVIAATGEPMPSGLHAGVAFERQAAFAWLTATANR